MIALTLTICIGNIEGLTYHGFYWGIEIDDRFYYHMALYYPNSSNNLDLDYYVIVDELPNIDENITNIPSIWESAAYEENNFCSFYLMNDTSIRSQTVSDDLRLNLHWSAYPVGNWSLINDLFLMPTNSSLFEVQTFDTAAEWGYTLTSIGELFGRNVTSTLTYSKENGAMNLYELNELRYESFYSVRITLVGDPIPLLVVFGGVYIGLLVVALVVLIREAR
ncbi:MAG: hypothetical protein ACFFDQ_08625 [Candidatus Thorarchaeota archaeon]